MIEPRDQSPTTIGTSSRGTWRLEGAILTWAYQESKFVSSSNPAITPEIGQKVEDEEMRKKSVFKSKILEVTPDSLRRISVESAHPEAVVEVKCRRVPQKS